MSHVYYLLIELTRFDGNPKNWPDFIQCFKEQVYCKLSFTDAFRMNLLLSLLDNEAKNLVTAIGKNGIFYASALKSLKKEFGNPYAVAHLKLKEILDLPQISIDDSKGLRHFHQQVKGAVTWLTSMGYTSSLKSTENVTKAVLRLPKQLRSSFYEKFTSKYFNEEQINLIEFEKWLQGKVYSTYNPIAIVIENTIRSNKFERHKDKKKGFNVNNSERTLKTESEKKDKFKTFCCFCKEEHRISNCTTLKAFPVEERYELIKQHRLCFNCLSNDHMIDKCQSKVTCKIDGCNKRHHTLLHRPKIPQPNKTPQIDGNKIKNQNSNINKVALLKIVPVILFNENKEIKTNALLDSGSDVTLISENLAKKLQLEGNLLNLNVSNALTKDTNVDCKSVTLTVSSLAKNFSRGEVEAYVVKELNINSAKYNILEMKEKYPYLKDIYFPSLQHSDVGILIGQNNADLLLENEHRKGNFDEPIAVRTSLGWMLIGNYKKSINSNNFDFNANNFNTEISEKLERFWTIESYGTKLNAESMLPSERKAIDILQKETVLKNGHFETPLLWKKDNVVLPNNRDIAIKRFLSLEKKFQKNPEFSKMYHTQISEYLELGYARKLEKHEALKTSNVTSYLPHHGVLHPNKPGKVRVVFDASAKHQNTCLNENLLRGPDLLNNLVSVLLKFRHGKFAVMSDIKGMYHQVNEKKRDTDSLRFIWREKPVDPLLDCAMLVHVFGKVDSTCCTNWSLREVPKYTDLSLSDAINKNFYMDDFLKSLSNEDDLISLSNHLITALSSCGFKLTKWISNSEYIMNKLPSSELSPKYVNLDLTEKPIERALGMIWDLSDDVFVFRPISKSCTPTKRGILSMVSSIFDPLGILTPGMLEAKLIVQELWRLGVDWDDNIPFPLEERWKKWLSKITSLDKFY